MHCNTGVNLSRLVRRGRLQLYNAGMSTQSSQKLEPSSEKYQYLEKSKIPTLHFQKSLPRLPIPELKKTCQRYLAAQTSLLTAEDFAETSKLVEEFEKTSGAALDKRLRDLDSANKHTSYISKPWFDMYLKDRVPLPLNYNPALVFVNAPSHLNTQLIRSTNLVVSSLRFMKSLRAGILSPEVFHLDPSKSDTPLFRSVTKMLPESLSWYGAYFFKAFPLDMSQYNNLFSSTRIPKPERDVIVKDESSRHLLVLRRGHFYKFDVLDKNGSIVPASDIQSCLKFILSQSDPVNQQSLGLFTSGRRDTWSGRREYLASVSAENAAALKDIDSALFVLCLDDTSSGGDPSKLLRNYLHGDGLNRWFDKSFSLILESDGTAGLNFEHSWGDGVAVLRYVTEILKDSVTNAFVDSDNVQSAISPGDVVKKIEFTLDDRIRSDLEKARTEFSAVCSSLGADVLQYDGFGKKNCKAAKLSPDSVMQLAFQVAYHKVYNTFVGTYESCSTAAFKHGRTETMRPNTIHTKAFAEAFNGRQRPSQSELIQLMQKCSALHGQLTKEAAMGEGFDRHMFALRNLATESGDMPAVFTHPSYIKMNHHILSTSTLSSPLMQMGGFGPVVLDGLGVGYSVLEDRCGALATTYPPNRDGAGFIAALSETLKEFSSLLTVKAK